MGETEQHEKNVTLPPNTINPVYRKMTYTSTDACLKKTTHSTGILVATNITSGDNVELFCSRREGKRQITEGCRIKPFVSSDGGGGRYSENATSNATSNPTITCVCSVVFPADTKNTSFSADFFLVANFAFSPLDKTFGSDMSVEPSPKVMLLCGVPSAMFLILLFERVRRRFDARTKQARKSRQRDS